MTIAELFRQLEQEPGDPYHPGARERRIPSRSGCDLFAGVQKPANTRTLRARFPLGAVLGNTELPQFRGLEVRRSISQDEGGEHATIHLRLLQPAFADIFTSLVEDVLGHVADIPDQRLAATALLNRLLTWQRFLERYSPEGLTPEEQRGLYGELCFLREHVLSHLALPSAVQAWTGPARTAKDFQFPGCAVEVKTSAAKQHQHLQIASEKQLDDTGLGALFLSHLSLEASQSAGETLPEAVAQLRALLQNDAGAAFLFEDKLREAGWLDAHEERYRSPRYIRREANLFRVRAGFPRIIERDLPSGVGDVRYSISVAECRHHAVAAEEMTVLFQEAA